MRYGRRCCAAEWTCAGRDGDERSFQRSAVASTRSEQS
jgi:hypothetical protein